MIAGQWDRESNSVSLDWHRQSATRAIALSCCCWMLLPQVQVKWCDDNWTNEYWTLWLHVIYIKTDVHKCMLMMLLVSFLFSFLFIYVSRVHMYARIASHHTAHKKSDNQLKNVSIYTSEMYYVLGACTTQKHTKKCTEFRSLIYATHKNCSIAHAVVDIFFIALSTSLQMDCNWANYIHFNMCVRSAHLPIV